MEMLLNLLLRFFGRWFARTAPAQSQEIEKGIDAVIPDEPTGNAYSSPAKTPVEVKKKKLRIGGNPSK